MLDARYVIIALILIATAFAIHRRPLWFAPLTLALAAAALAYAILFPG